MNILLTVIHLIACVSIIALVLVQQGKGSDIGAAFGSGASGTVFGSPGSGGFLLKLTAFVVAVFFATSLAMGYLSTVQGRRAAEQDLLLQQAPLPTDDTAVTAPAQNNAAPVSGEPAQTVPFPVQDSNTTAPLVPTDSQTPVTNQKENATDSSGQLPKDEKPGKSVDEKIPVPAE